MSDKIYTQYDLDKALENAASLAEASAEEACSEAYEEGWHAGRGEFSTSSSEAGAQNAIVPLRGENLTDCAIFILAKRGNFKPNLGEIAEVEAKLQEAGL